MRFRKALLPLLCIAFAGFLAARRGQRPPALVEDERVPVVEDAEAEAASPQPAASLPAPRPEEVQLALDRVFDGVVRPGGSRPTFDAADFNGDGSQDLAVVVVPVESRLPEINHELANWLIEDLRRAPRPAPAPPDAPAQVEPREPLLAMIHGFGAAGWRSDEARQAWLLRNVPLDGLHPLPPAEAASRCGDAPYLRGDVLALPSCRKSGFLYWTTARYALWPGGAMP
jgi:hypothetical protein